MRMVAREWIVVGVACALILALRAGVLGQQQAPQQAAGAQGAAPLPSQASIDAAAKVLADARQALGGEARLAGVRNFVATGRTRRVSGENLVPIEFEIDVELPDKYVRKDEIPAQETAPSSNGFHGDALVQIPPPAPPPVAASVPARPAANPNLARILFNKQEFGRLTLGMFAASFTAYPLTFVYVGQAEAPQGRADIVEARGADNFVARLFVASDTHLPLMVSWQSNPTPANLVLLAPGQTKPETMPPGGIVVNVPAAPATTAAQDEKDKYQKAVQTARQKAMAENRIENRVYYGDYRDADGVKLPFRLRRAVGAATIEETIFDKYKLNTKIDPKKFEAVK